MDAGPSLIKQLAACDNKTRNKTLNLLLSTWLPSQSAKISDEEMKKLWKGLFYCVWHADKIPAQTNLSNRLASLLPELQFSLSVQYFTVFLVTMRREWTGIDGLRLDKFYYLIRKFLHFFFLLLKKNSWDLEIVKRLMGVLVDYTFLDDDNLLGNGVNYHIASVFIEEFRVFLPLSKDVVCVVLGCFADVMGKVQDKILLSKIKSNVFDLLLKMGDKLLEVKKCGGDVDSGDDAIVLGPIGLHLEFSSKFYELGSAVECPQGNRKVLFGLYERFLKLEKDFAKSGTDISVPEVNEDVDDEAPDLVPIAAEMEVDGSNNSVVSMTGGSHLKKCKKTNKKAKKASGGSNKGKKKKKKNCSGSSDCDTEEDGNKVIPNAINSNEENSNAADMITLNESVISNLQMQFEKVAAEVGLDKNVESACDIINVTGNGVVTKKRKRSKSKESQQPENTELTDEVNADGGATGKSTEKSAKKVRFSMKNNLVWKPHSPLPPQSLRIPPSVTPRGSALKKGIPPGPIREMPVATKKAKHKTKSLKKGRKVLSGLVPVIRRPKKLKTVST
ncbi:ribosomal RNA processing protein 1 homolog [Ricinus communis]|uniref:ribosomal RNA processing protein 1 homolog n=1 Tax=Ricinus communis TaxID=3988 RepID=UPI00201ACB5E|nr:ribosomal RNA processing protein 1 homolog [Ricinus communis]